MQNLPTYNSEQEAFDFLDKKYNTGVPDDIKASWVIIEEYADCLASVAGEGNSGEFYNEKDAKLMEKALEQSRIKITNWFADKFGWKPIIAETSYSFFRLQKNNEKFCTSINGFWKFEKVGITPTN